MVKDKLWISKGGWAQKQEDGIGKSIKKGNP